MPQIVGLLALLVFAEVMQLSAGEGLEQFMKQLLRLKVELIEVIDARTGKEQWMIKVGGRFESSPICVNGVIYCMDNKGNVITFAAGPKAPKKWDTMPLGEPSRATPAVSDGRMYLRTESHLISIGGKIDGNEAKGSR